MVEMQVEVYSAASDASEKDDMVQTAIILNCAGPHILEMYDNFLQGDARDEDKPAIVLEALEKYYIPRDNKVIEPHRFWNIPYQDTFGKSLTELKTGAASCNFQEKDRMMTDQISFYRKRKASRITSQGGRFISQIKTPQLGDLGKATLRIDDSVPPKVRSCRKVPLAIQDAVKEELDQLEDKGVARSSDRTS